MTFSLPPFLAETKEGWRETESDKQTEREAGKQADDVMSQRSVSDM